MKKVCAILVALLFVFASVAVAEDLKAMTNDELLALRAAINAELMSRKVEKEVSVPIGTYKIGEDIPAGVYTISTKSMMIMISINDMFGHYVDMYTISPAEIIGKITLSEGETIQINGMGSAIFAPYVGLGF